MNIWDVYDPHKSFEDMDAWELIQARLFMFSPSLVALTERGIFIGDEMVYDQPLENFLAIATEAWERYQVVKAQKDFEEAERERLAQLTYLHREPKPYVPAKAKHGYVYLISGNGSYKIGKSLDPQKRLKELKLPFPAEIIHTIESNDYTRAEQHFHWKFAEKQINGEWFALLDTDIEYMKSITFWEVK